MYNVLEKLRAGERIEGKDREVYEQGLVGVLRKLHDDIDAEVAAAYGWPVNLTEHDLLQRLVDLNRERATEEALGVVRWLRPEYQNRKGTGAPASGQQIAADLALPSAASTGKAPWPATIQLQIAAVHAALEELQEASSTDIARRFTRVRASSIEPLLQGLSFIGKAQPLANGRFHIG